MTTKFCLDTKPDKSCGGELTEPKGLIYSPNYPQKYPKRTFCSWNINLPKGSRIILNFLAFDLEEDDDCL